MAADNYSLCLVGAMDRLWFHQIILSSEPISLLRPKALKTPKPISEPLTFSSSNLSHSPLPDEEISFDPSAPITPLQEICTNKDKEKEINLKERPTRLNLIASKTRPSYSSSPSTRKRTKNLRYSGAARRLNKTMSCKSLWELELEEVKGFMDLGFIFKKEQLSPRMMSVVPGLQRLGGCKNDRKTELNDAAEVAKDDETEEDEEEEEEEDEDEETKRGVMRPYLSEAWLIKRPDSPLLHLRLPTVSAAADMKKHLRFWARTVASVIQQES